MHGDVHRRQPKPAVSRLNRVLPQPDKPAAARQPIYDVMQIIDRHAAMGIAEPHGDLIRIGQPAVRPQPGRCACATCQRSCFRNQIG